MAVGQKLDVIFPYSAHIERTANTGTHGSGKITVRVLRGPETLTVCVCVQV